MSTAGHSNEFGTKNLARSCLPDEVSGTRTFKLDLWSEVKPGLGEDAHPILNICEDGGLLAVFDGMGGAGGASYKVEDGSVRTGASIASQLACACAEDYFGRLESEKTLVYAEFNLALADQLAAELTEKLRAKLKEEAEKLRTGVGRLGGKLVRALPTTMACIYYRVSPRRDRVSCLIFWAGDSRAYFLTHQSGLQQLTPDELKSEGDALQNLHDDSPVSNCINADSHFHILRGAKEYPMPVTLLVATDGCFNYFPTPFHFEHAIIASLMDSSMTEEGWKEGLNSRLGRVAADDFSMALVSLGWPHFERMKAGYEDRNQEIVRNYVEPSNRLDEAVRNLHEQHESKIEERKRLQQRLWTEYRKDYEAGLLPGRSTKGEK